MPCKDRSTYLIDPTVCPRRRHAGLWCIVHALQLAVSRARQRRHLARLDVCQLHDLGLSADEAAREARKPFWRR